MKKILLIHTGGTIGSSLSMEKEAREQNSQTVQMAKRYLISAFEQSVSAYAKEVKIIDAGYPTTSTTLSESMTPNKLTDIVGFINEKLNKREEYIGVVVLHGTDTLAYTAALFSFLFAEISIPIFLVSGNRPPQDSASNATANFVSAVNLICNGIAPNVYVTYRNSDMVTRLFLGSSIIQSPNFSEDFTGGSKERIFDVNDSDIFASCSEYSENRVRYSLTNIEKFQKLSDRVLLIKPYTGLDYSVYDHCLDQETELSYKGVMHGTYHSGTVALPGLVLLNEAERCSKNGDLERAEEYKRKAYEELKSSKSIFHLAALCKTNKVPLYIAPSTLGTVQYETMSVVSGQTDAVLLNMTVEAAYAKLMVALSYGLDDKNIADYMLTEINNEFCE